MPRQLSIKLCTLLLLGLVLPECQGQTKPARPKPGSKGTRSELDATIDRLGKTQPEWFRTTQLNYPSTLDLTWPMQAPQGGWNNQKNVGQFLWDVVNPNPGRWKEGVKLMHHLLNLHKDDPDKRERNMLTLARMYHNLLEDYGRSAFWFRAAGVEKDPVEYSRSAVVLAECYWRLGYEDEAKKLLEKIPPSVTHAKLLGDLGQTDQAIQMAITADDTDGYGFLVAGDSCRHAGRFDDALKYYQKVTEIPIPAQNPGRLQRVRARADANIQAITSFELSDPSRVPNGTYKSSSQGYEAPVEVAVTVRSGKIESVKITQHREKQFYSAMTDTPAKIISKQSVKGVDTTSNATITSEAIINATAKALASASKK